MDGRQNGVTISGLGWVLAGVVTLSVWRITKTEALQYTNHPGILLLGIIVLASGILLLIFRKRISLMMERYGKR